jgi:hypothetical protein
MHQPDKTQSGIALIMFLTIFLLSATGILLYRLNNRTSIMLKNQAQTAQALAQAKEALIGFAATYAETHPVHEIQQGFLPCPDSNGNGSANPACGSADRSVIGRFPWKTLGLPPLRDGSGECLWYAISGTYKKDRPETPPPLITNDTNGLFIVQNANDVTIAGDRPENQAIAVIFAPGRAIAEQDRSSTGNTKICGDENTQADDYLDSFPEKINNATGNGTLPFLDTALPLDTTSTFIQAPLTKTGFNDTLMLITPKDFEPVYERMNYWVAKQVAQCLEEYGKQYTRKILDKYGTQIKVYRAKSKINKKINKYLKTHSSTQCEAQCSEECSEVRPECEDCKSDCKEPLTTIKKYPWASRLDSFPVNPEDDYDDDMTNARFGRIPDILDEPKKQDGNMSSDWVTLNSKLCFNRSAGLGKHEWGWWKEWREEVFFAVDELHEPSATTYIWVKDNPKKTLCTLSQIIATPSRISECPINNGNLPSNQLTINSTTRKQSLVVMVAGRKLKLHSLEQKRTSPEEKKNINNYLEPDNIPGTGASDTIPPGDENFTSQWATDDFNDAVCGIGDIESSGEISCVNP